MIDKEKIRKEIERLRETSLPSESYHDALDDVLVFINSLPEEPVSEELDEAAENYGIRQGAELKPFAIKHFKAGAKYKEEQFEKCAIKTEVCERITQNGLLPSVTVLVNDCKPNEKVKVIVIKED